MAQERDALRSEVERLRAERDGLRDEVAAAGEHRSALEGAVLERQRQWEVDLLAARAEADRHAAALRDRDASLEAAFAERDRLRVEKGDAEGEAERLRAERDRLRDEKGAAEAESRRLGREQGERSRRDRDKFDWLAVAADDRDAAIEAIVGERAGLREAKEAVEVEADWLRPEIGRERPSRAQQGPDELDRLRTELEALRAEADRLAAVVRDRDAALAMALSECDRLAIEEESARVEAGRLRRSLHHLELDHSDRGEKDRAEIEQLRALIDRLRDGSEPLRAHVDPGAPPPPSTNGEEELRVARNRIATLQIELAEVRRVEGEMRSMLDAVGISFQEA
jgi:chromosome segregation ATPase